MAETYEASNADEQYDQRTPRDAFMRKLGSLHMEIPALLPTGVEIGRDDCTLGSV